jgi:hypothetical protein
MGLFDFVKSAGKKLGFGDDDEENAKELKKELDSYGLGTDAVQIEVQGDTASSRARWKTSRSSKSRRCRRQYARHFQSGSLGIEGRCAGQRDETGRQCRHERDHRGGRSGQRAQISHGRKGDTLWAIAEKAYGNGAKYEVIFEANRPMLTHPDKIYPGQVLRIPDLD